MTLDEAEALLVVWSDPEELEEADLEQRLAVRKLVVAGDNACRRFLTDYCVCVRVRGHSGPCVATNRFAGICYVEPQPALIPRYLTCEVYRHDHATATER